MSIERLISQLHKVKQIGSNRWLACCPSHNDKSPSLAIKDDSGKIFLNCFTGCSAYEIVSAVGMDISDLFPERTSHCSKPICNPFPATDILRCIQVEAHIVAVIASAIAEGEKLTEARKDRLMLAVGRIGSAYEQ
jgi:CHC2-type zinc finger protein